MQLVAAKLRRDFDAGDDLDGVAGRLACRVDARQRVMVGDRHGAEPAAPRQIDHLRRAVGAVAIDRVNVQIGPAECWRPGKRLAQCGERLARGHEWSKRRTGFNSGLDRYGNLSYEVAGGSRCAAVSASRRKRSRTPLTNADDSVAPNRRASSITSSSTTAGGFSFWISISNAPSRSKLRSTVAIRGRRQMSAAPDSLASMSA